MEKVWTQQTEHNYPEVEHGYHNSMVTFYRILDQYCPTEISVILEIDCIWLSYMRVTGYTGLLNAWNVARITQELSFKFYFLWLNSHTWLTCVTLNSSASSPLSVTTKTLLLGLPIPLCIFTSTIISRYNTCPWHQMSSWISSLLFAPGNTNLLSASPDRFVLPLLELRICELIVDHLSILIFFNKHFVLSLMFMYM
jgi:hypothetical protein